MAHKALRIGILQNGAMMEERVLRQRRAVSIGSGAGNTLRIPSDSLPDRLQLFALNGGRYHLNVTPAMTGKVSQGDRLVDFAAAEGAADGAGGLSIALAETSRGRVVLGDVTVLFQFVEPPARPVGQLPSTVRGRLVDAQEWPFVATLMASLLFQVAAVAFVVTRDYPEALREVVDLDNRFLRGLQRPVEVLVPPKPVETPVEKTPDAQPVSEARPPKRRQPRSAPPAKPATERSRMEARVRKETIISHLGTNGGDGPGFVQNMLKDGADMVSMEKAFEGAGLAVNTPRRRGRRGPEDTVGTVAKLGVELEAQGPRGPVRTGDKRETKMKGQVKLKRLDDRALSGPGRVSPKAIADVIRRRKRAVKTCYERYLKLNNRLAGTVRVRFTIEQSGRVRVTETVSNSTREPRLAQCLSSQLKRWRFPRPDDGAVTVAFPFVFTPAAK